MAICKVLVPVTGRLASTAALDLAVAVGRTLYAHIEALHMRPNPLQALRYLTGYEAVAWLEETGRELERQADAVLETARLAFTAWAQRAQVELNPHAGARTWDVSAKWREVNGMPEEVIADLGRFSDLILLARPNDPDIEARLPLIQAALFDTGRPVLLAPPALPHSFGREALVGWNGSREALHALTGALPLLSRMKRVVLITIGETEHPNPLRDDELLDYLACHGLKPARITVEADRRGAGTRLLDEAKEMKADLLVMGAYRHSRLREAILGGATRHVIETADLPVLLAH
jgi:nucleotide-binding universal stress UspA family protein